MRHLFLSIASDDNILSFCFAHNGSILAVENLLNNQANLPVLNEFPLWELLSVILALFSCFLSFILFRQRKLFFMQRYRLNERLNEQLRLIRSLLDLCYAYRESPAVFLDKFKDKVNIRELKSYVLIEPSNKHFFKLKEEERILCSLLEAGFTHRELCVIFNLKKTSNLYTKYHRILQKLNQDKIQDSSVVEKS